MSHLRRRAAAGRLAALLIVPLFLLGAACGDDDDSVGDAARDAADSVADAAQDVSARSVAEAFRAALVADPADGQDRRAVAVLEETAADLPGEPEVLGIGDADGDGLDDDGRVELRVDDQSSCLLIGAGGDLNIENC